MYPGMFRGYPGYGMGPRAYPRPRYPLPPGLAERIRHLSGRGVNNNNNPRGPPGPPRPPHRGQYPNMNPDDSSQFWQMVNMQPDLYGVPADAAGMDAVSSNPFFRSLMQQQEAADHALKTKRVERVCWKSGCCEFELVENTAVYLKCLFSC